MDELRLLVAQLVADDHDAEQIGIVLGMTPEKVEVVFRRELEHGHVIARAHALCLLQKSADAGSVSAVKELADMCAQNRPGSGSLGKKALAQFTAQRAIAAGGTFAPVRPPGVGKKEFAKLMSEHAEVGTEWEDILRPREPKGKSN